MNVRSIVRGRSARGERLVHRLWTLDRVGWLRYVWFWGMFLHGSYTCNKPALEGRD